MQEASSSGGGFKIPLCGKTTGRNLILPSVANDLINHVNPLGNIQIVRTEAPFDAVYYSDSNVVIALKKEKQAPNVEGSVTVAEIDGAPSVANVTTIKFPNGSVADNTGGVVTVTPYITVEEVDGTPSVSAKKIVFPNASVTDSGSGTATVAFVSGGVSQYRVKSVQGDYCTCRTWDGTTEGSTDVYVAKPYKLRNSITSATIDGVSVSYSYTSTVARTATISSTDEDQVIVPRYLSNDLIYAVTSNYTGVSVSGTPLTLIDINADGRAWAKE